MRQAHLSFNFALIATALYLTISFLGASYLINNQTSEGAVATAVGLIASLRYMQIAKDATNRLDKMMNNLNGQ